MARSKRKSEEYEGVVTGGTSDLHKLDGTQTRFSIQVGLVKAREMVTVPPNAACWKPKGRMPTDVHDAFVRVLPPHDAEDETVERVREALVRAGALVVRVLPRPKRAVVISAPDEEKKQHRSARQVVTELVEASNTQDKEALHVLVEKIMGHVGI